jgi:phage terminase large subunit
LKKVKTPLKLPEKLIPVFQGEADVRAAYGGRGSAKTRSFAKMIAAFGVRFGQAGVRGILLCARQYMNSLADSSLEECKRAIEEEPSLLAYYEIGVNYIKSKDGRIQFAFAGMDRNIASVKSKGRILVCWVDEAEPVTEAAWETLDPTLREEGEGWNAELWVTWNPARKGAAVERKFRNSKNPRIKCVEMNWRDNPKFPAILERKRSAHKIASPDTYDHVWEGAYVTAIAGAYYASSLTQARAEGRIGRVPADPLMVYRLFTDIGGTGAKADNFVFWAAQFVARELRVLNHYEAQGQPLSAHLTWLRENGYTPGNTQIVLPHDGDNQEKILDQSYASALRDAGYEVIVIPNQGKGAAKQRVEAGRRVFPAIWFNLEKTEAGLAALGWYHEKKDEERGIGLGPEHDWSSHSADAFGMMCMVYEPPEIAREEEDHSYHGSGAWMG